MYGFIGSYVMAHACNPSTWEIEAEGSGVQGHPLLHSEFEAGLDYIRHSENKSNDPFKVLFATVSTYAPNQYACKDIQTCAEGFVCIISKYKRYIL